MNWAISLHDLQFLEWLVAHFPFCYSLKQNPGVRERKMCTRMVTLCAEPNTYSGSTVHSDGRTIHVPNLIRGEKKYHPYCLKQGNKLKKVKFTKPGISCFDFSVILCQGDS